MNSAFKRVVPKNNFLPTESNILLESTVNDPAFENSETGCLSINQKVEIDFTNILEVARKRFILLKTKCLLENLPTVVHGGSIDKESDKKDVHSPSKMTAASPGIDDFPAGYNIKQYSKSASEDCPNDYKNNERLSKRELKLQHKNESEESKNLPKNLTTEVDDFFNMNFLNRKDKQRPKGKITKLTLKKSDGHKADLVSDTHPVSMSIMDEMSKEMLEKKNYNEYLDELMNYC